MELNGWASPQMLRRYGASARGARARRSYDRVMEERWAYYRVVLEGMLALSDTLWVTEG